RFQQQGVDAVLVDVGTNPGGDDSGDTLARLFSGAPVQSAPLWVSQSAAGRDYLQEQYERIDDALRHHHPDATARTLLVQQRDRFAASLRATQAPPCDMTWVWQAPRDWPTLPCRQLVAAGSSGGPLPTPGVDALSDFLIAHRLDWAQDLRRHWAAWQGPVYVLTDAKTASSAEMFAARLQDNRIARVVGSTTGGYGCGFMSPPPPRALPHSQLRMRIPNCVRLRADGSDEVAGISPDLPIDMPANASARARAQQVLEAVGADLARH
ncbi:MAG: S41 family peptidase, partial [Stenotrophomonas maltophilia]